MLGYATYNGHQVQVIEILIDRNRPDESCALINFGGVAWVALNDLTNLQLVTKGA
jgi:hypothetical protein